MTTPYAIVITSSEIPAIPEGTTYPNHTDASQALTSLASIMPKTWDSFKFSVGVAGISTPHTELRCGEAVDTAELVASWIEHADTHGETMDYQRWGHRGC